MDRNTILNIVYNVMSELNTDRGEDNQLVMRESTVLVGPDSALDSLGLVNLIVGIEEKVTDKLGFDLDLTSEGALPQPGSQLPESGRSLRTVGALVDYIVILLKR